MIFPRTKYFGGKELRPLACSPMHATLLCKVIASGEYIILKPEGEDLLGVAGLQATPSLTIKALAGDTGIILDESKPLPVGFRAFYVEAPMGLFRYYLSKETPEGKVYVCDDLYNTGLTGTTAGYIPADADDVTPILPILRGQWSWEIFLGTVECSLECSAVGAAVPIYIDEDYITQEGSIYSKFWLFSEPAGLVIESDSPPWIDPGITVVHLLFNRPVEDVLEFDPEPNNSIDPVLSSRYQQAHYSFSLNLSVDNSHFFLDFYRSSAKYPPGKSITLDRIIFDM